MPAPGPALGLVVLTASFKSSSSISALPMLTSSALISAFIIINTPSIDSQVLLRKWQSGHMNNSNAAKCFKKKSWLIEPIGRSQLPVALQQEEIAQPWSRGFDAQLPIGQLAAQEDAQLSP
jgi:hypothetical protein